MQGDFRIYHNEGYETVEGITAGTKQMVDFDTYLDAGVPKGEATTDSPSSPLVLKDRDGKIISDRNGNLFHYVIEPTLWGTKEIFVRRLNAEAAAKVKPVTVLPRADVLTAAADDCARKIDELLAIATRWQPTLDECVGALVWMTPTLNGYFDDWRDSRYNPQASLGRYVAESRVLDMRGIMSSLQLICNAILPEVDEEGPRARRPAQERIRRHHRLHRPRGRPRARQRQQDQRRADRGTRLPGQAAAPTNSPRTSSRWPPR